MNKRTPQLSNSREVRVHQHVIKIASRLPYRIINPLAIPHLFTLCMLNRKQSLIKSRLLAVCFTKKRGKMRALDFALSEIWLEGKRRRLSQRPPHEKVHLEDNLMWFWLQMGVTAVDCFNEAPVKRSFNGDCSSVVVPRLSLLVGCSLSLLSSVWNRQKTESLSFHLFFPLGDKHLGISKRLMT